MARRDKGRWHVDSHTSTLRTEVVGACNMQEESWLLKLSASAMKQGCVKIDHPLTMHEQGRIQIHFDSHPSHAGYSHRPTQDRLIAAPAY